VHPSHELLSKFHNWKIAIQLQFSRQAEPFRPGSRLIDVAANTADQNVPLERLREDYKDAFDEWATEVNHLQTVSESGPDGGAVVKEAEGRVEAAHRTYRDSRDRLAEDMAGCGGHRNEQES
jgi:hypothetical protein